MPENPIILNIQGNDGFELEFEESEDLDFETQPYSKGDPGKSAYQVAVDNGFSGTEEEWLASLVGPQGPAGPQGQTGPQGVAGNDGFSPTATVTKSGSVATITITDKNGTTTANVYDGSGGGGNVYSVNGQMGDVVLTASDVGALPDSTAIPSKTSDLDNDAGFISSYTETDPIFTASAAHGITSTDITNWNNKSDFSGDYDDLTGKPEIDDVYWCTYGTTTSAQIETALTAGKIPMVRYQDYVYTLRYRNSATNHRFVCNYGGKEKSVACQSGTWIPNGDLTFLTTSYTAPVTSVNGQTGDVSIPATVIDASPTQNSTNAVSSGGVWSDINTITNLTENNIAWVETSNIATRTYNIDDYVIINGVLCKITATVASGSTLTSGTNYIVLGGSGGISNDISTHYYTARNPFAPTASDTAQTIIAKAITATVAKITSGYAYIPLSYPNHSWGCDVQVFVCEYVGGTSLAVSGTLNINNGRSATPGEAYIFSARWDKPTSEVAALKVSNAISLSLVS